VGEVLKGGLSALKGCLDTKGCRENASRREHRKLDVEAADPQHIFRILSLYILLG
jgi:hypothetical protein